MKRITRASIIGAIADKFSLQEFEREEFLFSELVVPTYDIGGHVKDWQISRTRISITTNGVASFGVVPENENWKIRRMTVIHETGANFDIDQVFHYNLARTTDIDYIFYDTTSPLTSGTVKIFEFPLDIQIVPRDRIAINVSNFVGGGYVALHVLKEVEVVR